MKDFADIKKEIYSFVVKDPLSESKYGKFLDLLAWEYDLRGKDNKWDLWYFSNNTEFCRDSAKHFLEEIKEQYEELKKFRNSEKNNLFRISKVRMSFGCFCFYLYAALESFAHEINIFYELNTKRKVTITNINKELKNKKKDCELYKHFEIMFSDPNFKKIKEHRNAVAHGYVYPVSIKGEGCFVPDRLRIEKISFKNTNTDLLPCCQVLFTKVNNFICKGWRCFEIDELTG